MTLKNLFTFFLITLEKFVYLFLNYIGCVLLRYLKNATNNITGMFYLHTFSARHKIMQDKIGSARVGSRSDWESSRFRITGLGRPLLSHKTILRFLIESDQNTWCSVSVIPLQHRMVLLACLLSGWATTTGRLFLFGPLE